MEIIYENTAKFDEVMKSGIMKEIISAICIEGHGLTRLITVFNENFRTNLNTKEQKFSDLDLLIWVDDMSEDHFVI